MCVGQYSTDIAMIDSPGRVCISLPFQHMLSQHALSPLAVCQWMKDATKHTI